MVSVEQLYKDYEILAEAGADAGKHEKSYASILSAVGGEAPQKQLAGQFIPKFFKYFPSMAEQAINAQLDLCEDDISMIRRQAIKELPNLCKDSADHLLRIADVLTQLLQSDDLPELNIVRSALMALYNIDPKGTLGGIFNQILSGEDKVRDRAIKFLSNKIQTLPPERIPKDVEEFLVEKSKEVLADVTGEEFVIFMKLLSGLSSMQTLLGRKQLLDLVTEQADLSSDFQHTDSDCVDRLMQCIRQAMPFFSKNVQSTAFVSYICERVLPNISSLASTPDENGASEEEKEKEKKDKEKDSDSDGAKLEMLKLLSEMAANCGDLSAEPHIANLYSTLVEYMPLPPPTESEDSENTPASEGPQLQFSYVECLMYTFHQLARKHPEFLTSEDEIVAERLKDFRLRLQYFARGVQLYKRQLRLALQGKSGDQLKSDENKLKVVALRITSNIDILTKDLFHNPPSYKSTVILSWRPVNKQPPSPKEQQQGQKRTNITPISFPEGTTPAKKKTQNRGGGGGQKRGNRGMYAPPGGKYSQKAGTAPGGGDANYGDSYGGNQRYQNQRGRGGYGRNRGRGRGRYY